jgi:hypothetical protein
MLIDQFQNSKIIFRDFKPYLESELSVETLKPSTYIEAERKKHGGFC